MSKYNDNDEILPGDYVKYSSGSHIIVFKVLGSHLYSQRAVDVEVVWTNNLDWAIGADSWGYKTAFVKVNKEDYIEVED